MASYVWGDDFEAIKAGGSGDKKSDGRRIKEEIIFQCYAPESSSEFAKKSPSKVQDSFPEVLSFWPKLREWVFVYNHNGSITAKLSDTLEGLRKDYPKIIIKTWRKERLKAELHDKLTLGQLRDVYPEYIKANEPVDMKDIIPLLKSVLKRASDSLGFDVPMLTIPKENKLDYNTFSIPNKFALKRGMVNIHLVENYISGMSIPANATKIQNAMTEKYKELTDLWAGDADSILEELRKWMRHQDTPREQSAAEVIIAYFFDSCDIYKNPPDMPKGKL